MNLCLISAPTATECEYSEDARSRAVRLCAEEPQLGVLVLAAVVDAEGLSPYLVNLNRCYYDYLDSGGCGVDKFARFAADRLLATNADVYGFSSICNSYPLTIRIAELVKQASPHSTILLGGPQASVVDLRTLSAFPFVDYILRGEADETLPIFLSTLSQGGNLADVAGLTWRSPFGATRNPSAPVVRDLDRLPLPAFHLTDELKGLTKAPLELGRGCPFSCTFCSTNDFFRRNFRLRSAERVLQDMRTIAAKWGIHDFDLAHDMFTVDRRRVAAFCEHMLAAGEDFTWGCSARTDCVDHELLELMYRAGCRSVFFGVETGSQRMQKIIDKDLDVARAREIISITDRLGIRSTVSVITGFPEEQWQDVRETVDIYMHSLAHPHSSPQFNLLAALAETPIHAQYRDQLTLEELCSNIGHQGRSQNELDRELIRQYPDIFPNFYLLPVPLDRDTLLELREFLLRAPLSSRWLLVALHRTTSGVLDVFFAWRKYRDLLHSGLRGWQLREYYMGDAARIEFARFVRLHLGAAMASEVDCLTQFCGALAQVAANRAEPHQGEPVTQPFAPDDIPMRAPNLFVLEFDWDVQAVIEGIKHCTPVCNVDRSPRFYRTSASEGDDRVLQTTPLMAAGLEACDGHNTVAGFIDCLAAAFDGPADMQRLAGECLLETLHERGLVTVHRPAPLHRASLPQSPSVGENPVSLVGDPHTQPAA